MTDTPDSLPLAVFEEYMLLDDRASHPMEFFCLLQFRGDMDDDRFVQAVRRVVLRHPLMYCVIERATARDWRWVPSAKDVDVRFLDARVSGTVNESGFPNTRRLDVFSAPGFRAYVVKKEAGCDVVFQFHHTVSDGMGASQFIREFLLTYALLSGQGSWRLLGPVPDSSLLPLRADIGWTVSSYLKNIRYTWHNIAKFVFGRTRTILPWRGDPTETPTSYPTIVSQTLTREETSDFFKAAKLRGATVNDALIDSAVRTGVDWQRSVGFLPRGGRFRVAVPMNLRDERFNDMPVGNVVTMVFLDFLYRDLLKNQSLLDDVHRQMDSIKKHEQGRLLGGILLFGKRSAMLIGQNLSIHLRNSRCRSTICLSNLGRPLEDWSLTQTENRLLVTGDMVLESLMISPPIRPKTFLSYSATTYADKLNLSLRYDPCHISKQNAQTLLNLMFTDIRDHVFR
ncbi:MAG: condensation domain-containing protein [Thermoguttaceae bacterium]|nr:condensation domain-containing protein [Thermoguttaceae bacterium]